MKIATLSNASVGHTARWVEWFRARGHDVRLWSLEPGPDSLGAQQLPAPPLPGALRYPLAAPALATALARFAPDVIDAHYVPNYGVLATLTGRHPLSVTAWGSDLLIAGPRDALQRVRARWVLSRADALIADSENLAAAARTLGAPPDRTHVIPWGVDRTRFWFAAQREPGLIVSTRMHEPVYGIETVIDALAPVLARHPHARLAIAGEGSLRAALEARAAARLPGERVRFVGRLSPDEMAELLRRADLFVSASYSDSTSVSLLEAMACGALPVVSAIDGNREWVNEADGGRLFAAGDPPALAAAIERAWADPAWARDARTRNAQVIERRGDARTNMARIESLFEGLAQGGRT